MKTSSNAGNKLAGTALGGLAAVLGMCAVSAAPASAQEVYVRSGPPAGAAVIVEEPGYIVAPEPRVVVRETPAYPAPLYETRERVIVREAPERVIVTEPMNGPFANEVYVREAAPAPLPPRAVGDLGGDCHTVERDNGSGVIQVSTFCD